MRRGILALSTVCLGALLFFPAPGLAFTEWQSEEVSVSLRGFTGLSAGYSHNPEAQAFYDSQDDLLWDLEQRLVVAAKYREDARFDL
ncbi:MAG: hypothetical protein V1782_06365, partial [Pseudomonadota bacterium]